MAEHSQSNGQEPAEAPVRWLMWLERLPKAAVFLAVLVVTLGVLFTPPPAGPVLVLLLAAATGFMVYARWGKFTPSTRFTRVLVVVLLAAMGVAKFFI